MNNRETIEVKTDLLEKAFGKWWMMLLEGFCLLILCGIMLINKSATFELLILLVGIYRGVMGGIYIVTEIVYKQKHGDQYGLSLFRGVVDLIIAGICIFLPNLIINFVVVIFGIWAVLSGAFFAFIGMRSEGVGKIPKVVLGIALIAFGFFTFFQPTNIANFLTFLIGIALGISGLFLIVQSFGMKKHYKKVKKELEGYKEYEVK